MNDQKLVRVLLYICFQFAFLFSVFGLALLVGALGMYLGLSFGARLAVSVCLGIFCGLVVGPRIMKIYYDLVNGRE